VKNLASVLNLANKSKVLAKASNINITAFCNLSSSKLIVDSFV
jgi:hypothetical protein